MYQRLRLWQVFVVVLLVALVRTAFCGEPDARDKVAKKYRDLVRQLVSPNKKASTKDGMGDDGSVKFPKGYDVKAQQRIEKVRRTLQANIEDSLPFLIEALGDERYCMTISWAEGEAYYNRSVGGICEEIILSHLEVYRRAISFSGPGHWNRYHYPVSKEWFKSRTGRTLVALQIEAIDWAIEQRRAEPAEQTGDDQKRAVDNLKELRIRISKSGVPEKPRELLRMQTSDRR